MMYFPPSVNAANRENSYSWRSSEPVCLGLSAERKGPSLDLQKLHEAREIPPGQDVDFSLVLGHAVYQSNSNMKVLPPGCMTGLEFVRFCKMVSSATAPAAEASASGSEEGAASAVMATDASELAPSSLAQSAIKAVTGSLKRFASGFRILTSDADTNARLSKTWSSVVNFDPQQYAGKFEGQAQKNLGAMSKWLRELQDAVSKPKA